MPGSNARLSNFFKYNANKYIFRYFETSCFAHPMKTHSTRHRYKANPTAIRNLRLLLHFSAHWSRDSHLSWMIPPRQVNNLHPTHSSLPGVPLLSSSLGGGLENFEHYFTSVWHECNCVVVWAFFGTAFLWVWNENWPLVVLWPLLSFPNFLAYRVQHFHSIIF